MATIAAVFGSALLLDAVQSAGVIFACTTVAGVLCNVWLQSFQTQCATRMKFGDVPTSMMEEAEDPDSAGVASDQQPNDNSGFASWVQRLLSGGTNIPRRPPIESNRSDQSGSQSARPSTVTAAPKSVSSSPRQILPLNGGKRVYVDPVSSVWCRSVSPCEAMAHGLAILLSSCSIATVRAVLAERFVPIDFRFTCQLKADIWGNWYWNPLMFFQIENHVTEYRHELSDATSEQFISSLFSIAPNMDLPPWRVIVCPKYRTESGRYTTAMILRFHHALADGFSLLQCVLKSFDSAQTVKTKRLSSSRSVASSLLTFSSSAHTTPSPRRPIGKSISSVFSAVIDSHRDRQSTPTRPSRSTALIGASHSFIPFSSNRSLRPPLLGAPMLPTSSCSSNVHYDLSLSQSTSVRPRERLTIVKSNTTFFPALPSSRRRSRPAKTVSCSSPCLQTDQHPSNLHSYCSSPRPLTSGILPDTDATKRPRVLSVSDSTTCDVRSESGSYEPSEDIGQDNHPHINTYECSTTTSVAFEALTTTTSVDDQWTKPELSSTVGEDFGPSIHPDRPLHSIVIDYSAKMGSSLLSSLSEGALYVWAVISLGYRLTVCPSDSPSLFKTREMMDEKCPRSTAWRRLGISVQDVKLISKRLGISKTEIIVTAISGGMRDYRQQQMSIAANGLLNRSSETMLSSDQSTCSGAGPPPDGANFPRADTASTLTTIERYLLENEMTSPPFERKSLASRNDHEDPTLNLFSSQDYRAMIWASIRPDVTLHPSQTKAASQHFGVLGNMGLGGVVVTIPTAEYHYSNQDSQGECIQPSNIVVQTKDEDRNCEVISDTGNSPNVTSGWPFVDYFSSISNSKGRSLFGWVNSEFAEPHEPLNESPDVLSRAQFVHQRLQTSRHRKEPFAMNLFLRLVSSLPTRSLFLYFWHLASSKATVSISTLSTAAQRLYVGSSPVESLVFFSPPQAMMGVAFGSMCYADALHISITADYRLLDINECRRLLELIDHSMTELRRCTLQ